MRMTRGGIEQGAVVRMPVDHFTTSTGKGRAESNSEMCRPDAVEDPRVTHEVDDQDIQASLLGKLHNRAEHDRIDDRDGCGGWGNQLSASFFSNLPKEKVGLMAES